MELAQNRVQCWGLVQALLLKVREYMIIISTHSIVMLHKGSAHDGGEHDAMAVGKTAFSSDPVSSMWLEARQYRCLYADRVSNRGASTGV